MYTKVWGRVDGKPVEWVPASANTFELQVPADYQDGYYVCEIWAQKDSGAIGYRTAILWIADGRLVCIKLAEDSYTIDLLPDPYSIKLTQIRCCND